VTESFGAGFSTDEEERRDARGADACRVGREVGNLQKAGLRGNESVDVEAELGRKEGEIVECLRGGA